MSIVKYSAKIIVKVRITYTEITQFGASLIAQLVKNPLAIQEILVQFLGQEDPLEKGQATNTNILRLPLWLSQQRICLERPYQGLMATLIPCLRTGLAVQRRSSLSCHFLLLLLLLLSSGFKETAPNQRSSPEPSEWENWFQDPRLPEN